MDHQERIVVCRVDISFLCRSIDFNLICLRITFDDTQICCHFVVSFRTPRNVAAKTIRYRDTVWTKLYSLDISKLCIGQLAWTSKEDYGRTYGIDVQNVDVRWSYQ